MLHWDDHDYARDRHEEEESEKEQPKWLEQVLLQQNFDAIRTQIKNRYAAIKDELSARNTEIQYLKTSPHSNLLAISCWITIEKLSRDLITLPILDAILSRNATDIHSGKYLTNFIDTKVDPIDFFYDFFKTSTQSSSKESQALGRIKVATRALGEDGFFIKAPGLNGPTTLKKWLEVFRNFRNQLVHGRMTSSNNQALFILSFYENWIDLIDHSISKYGSHLRSDLVLLP